ncbi:MAG TPA: methylenetetrahydrofolate--tRNA-(uracil(54)-C(5))-methyltransferase (FADH(2)-oxidizing) TrmFO [Bacillota bacterium]|nr:methylenetetrahydrofolate--tRNA-(uracil(54)-C(5))-methyltransferase (FADH(2)-oxidizing) TrmFO [Bacillota bacterium]
MGEKSITVIGAGLAGVEAALQIANRNVVVDLYEMKKIRKSPAHKSDDFAELVCSNSLRSDSLENAVGLMKAEMRLLKSEVIEAADKCRVPAGSALAVDRNMFSSYLTEKVRKNPLITIHEEEMKKIPEGIVIIATGPLTDGELASSITKITGQEALYFYDAVAPIIEFDTIDMNVAYYKNRYDKGDGMYINCPMDKDEYDAFYNALIDAKCAPIHDFEMKVFEGCMPVEEMARRGYETLLYGPMKPVGLERDEKRPYAVVQLRQDDLAGTLYNIVGFQTHLLFSEQKKLIRMIPGLKDAKIVRYGVTHRNSYVKAPEVLLSTYQMKNNNNVFIAGQLSGVEGYVESIASGLVAGINAYRLFSRFEPLRFPLETAIGSQANYLEFASPSQFQPMNANFGLFPALDMKYKKRDKKGLLAKRSMETMEEFIKAVKP